MARYLHPDVERPARPHQIVLTQGVGRLSAKTMVGCTCGARPIATEAGTPDHWAMFNLLHHDPDLGPFERVDPVTGPSAVLAASGTRN